MPVHEETLQNSMTRVDSCFEVHISLFNVIELPGESFVFGIEFYNKPFLELNIQPDDRYNISNSLVFLSLYFFNLMFCFSKSSL